MTQDETDRRGFLRLGAGAAAGAAIPPSIARALDLPARRRTGSLADLEHVVIFMQENRAFDHYFGAMRGVRGFADPRPIRLPGGADVFHQPRAPGSAEVVTPFHMDTATTSAQGQWSLDHSWKVSHETWKHHDAWVAKKSALTMGYFTRADLPFYYALADAFTVCDAYHCSIFAPTNPNRLYLFTGTSGLAAGDDGAQVVANTHDEINETADPARDSRTFKPYRWPTYAERLQGAGISWRLYQEFDNYGDNALAYFANFRGLAPDSPLYRRGRAWVEGSNAANARTSNGEHLVRAFAADVAADRLPRVSWIVAPYRLCEHPSATPAAGEDLTSRLIGALTDNPAVWAKTALILTYDENDGFFDHAPLPVPPVGAAPGKSTVSLEGEAYQGVPVGLGPRVPTIVVSPWTKGGYVNSQTFDHTSVIRLLEARFGVREPHITPWRRAVTGDLTSVFDFTAPDRAAPRLPGAAALPAQALAQASLPRPRPPASSGPVPAQERGGRPARPLPYAFEVVGRSGPSGFELTVINRGAAGAAFLLYTGEAAGSRHYTVEAGKRISDRHPAGADGYDLTLHGPNGFLRQFRGGPELLLDAAHRHDANLGVLTVRIANVSAAPLEARIANAYAPVPAKVRGLAPGAVTLVPWPIAAADHWYDIEVTVAGHPRFLRRLAGHVETGAPSRSDPALDGRRRA
jgi:phospholipase C